MTMDEDVFNMGIRKFLKKVGITSQRTIEQAVRDALQEGRIDDSAAVKVSMTLTIEGLGGPLTIDDRIALK
jgi:hypothetical protein